MVNPNEADAVTSATARAHDLVDQIEQALLLADQLGQNLIAAHLNQALVLAQQASDALAR